MARVLLEVCVDSAAGLAAAVAGGADRIELCAALAVGGLSPSPGLLAVAARCGVPVYAMIRSRAGDFVFGDAEVAVMEADIAAVRDAGLAGVVIGVSRPDGRLDGVVLARLMARAAGLGVTLHRAIDLVPDWAEALDTAVALGVERILTSGRALRAVEGLEALAEAVSRVGDRVVIMPGSGVSVAVVPQILALGVREVHASCALPVPGSEAALRFGFCGGAERQTDAGQVAALRAALGG